MTMAPGGLISGDYGRRYFRYRLILHSVAFPLSMEYTQLFVYELDT